MHLFTKGGLTRDTDLKPNEIATVLYARRHGKSMIHKIILGYQEIVALAASLGLTPEELETITSLVRQRAESSTWGTVDERLTEIRRLVLTYADYSKRSKP